MSPNFYPLPGSKVFPMADNIPKAFLFFLCSVLLALSFTQKISFTTADLGRHLKNGEIFFQRHQPIVTNFYSFTEPDFPAINHHWLTGVVFFLVHQMSGFEGLSVFYTFIFLLAFYFFFETARKKSNFYYALFFSLVSVPLILCRREIRPEGLTCLWMGFYFWLLYRVKRKKTGYGLLWLLPLCQIVWVNSHILFFLGIMMVWVFVLDAWINEKDKDIRRRYLALGIAVIAACFLNPFGLNGVLTPLTIFREYGYMIAENQSVFFMQKRFPQNPLYWQFEIRFLVCLVSFIAVCFQAGGRKNILDVMLFVCFAILAWKANRSIQMFGLFFIPFSSMNFYLVLEKHAPQFRTVINKLLLFFSILILLSGMTAVKLDALENPRKILGLSPNVNDSVEFFKRNKIKGPVFNNYDIGGYLIYHLFPGTRVFVDNRPEAYSVSFFKNIYVPMQESEEVWTKMDEKYRFNVIYFFRRDMTPWAHPFLIRRSQDPLWAPVFVDVYTILFLKRNEKNARLIKTYELPLSIFKIEH